MFLPIFAALSTNGLLALALVAIVLLILLIARFKCNATVALVFISMLLGLCAGMEPLQVVKSFDEGVGKTLSSLAMVIGLGTMLGKLLGESGAAHVIATRIIAIAGRERLDYAIMIAAFVIGVSVFFQVGVLLLGPIVFALARETRTPILRLGLPLAAGMSTAHGLIPPHPGPMAAIGLLGADPGKTIAWSMLVVGPPVALLTGPLLARWVVPRVPLEIGGLGAVASSDPSAPRRPGLGVSLFTILLPVLLMLIASFVMICWPEKQFPAETWQGGLRKWTDFIGQPTVAMLAAVLVAFWTFGIRVGLDASAIGKFAEQCLAPVGSVLLVIAAGGGFSRVLGASGIATAFADIGGKLDISPLLLGWLVAGMLRVSVGSATVSVTTAAGIMLPIVNADPTINKELLVLAMGAGSLILSHVNDGGFWLVKEYFGMTIPQTLKTWTVVETGIACASIVLILIVNAFL
ncbi:MAG: gluconate:H+ symporter [Chthoniobacteraceae bacterium]